MKLSIIAAMSEQRVIGIQNRLPWRLPADLGRFKELTMGRTLIMGRKTFESIGKPLPGRKTIIVTRNPSFYGGKAHIAHSIQEALDLALEIEGDNGEAFVAGGAEIYEATLDRATRLYLTIVRGTFQGDTYFPEVDFSEWQLLSEEDLPADHRHPVPFSFRVYRRIPE